MADVKKLTGILTLTNEAGEAHATEVNTTDGMCIFHRTPEDGNCITMFGTLKATRESGLVSVAMIVNACNQLDRLSTEERIECVEIARRNPPLMLSPLSEDILTAIAMLSCLPANISCGCCNDGDSCSGCEGSPIVKGERPKDGTLCDECDEDSVCNGCREAIPNVALHTGDAALTVAKSKMPSEYFDDDDGAAPMLGELLNDECDDYADGEGICETCNERDTCTLYNHLADDNVNRDIDSIVQITDANGQVVATHVTVIPATNGRMGNGSYPGAKYDGHITDRALAEIDETITGGRPPKSYAESSVTGHGKSGVLDAVKAACADCSRPVGIADSDVIRDSVAQSLKQQSMRNGRDI